MKHSTANSILLAALLVDASAFVIVDGETAQVAFAPDTGVSDQTFHLWEDASNNKEEAAFVLDADAEGVLDPWVTAFNSELAGGRRRHHHGHKWPKENGHHPEEQQDDVERDPDPFAPANYWHPHCFGKPGSDDPPGGVRTHAEHPHCSLMDYIRRKPGCAWGPDRDDDHDHPPPDHPPHHGPPPPPHHPPHPPGKGPRHPPPGKGPHHPPPPHRRPGHGRRGRHHSHDLTNGTIYQNLGLSKYTSKIFGLLEKDEKLTKLLNSTDANFTFFAPLDKAFERIPKHGKKPSEDFIADLLRYHTLKGQYPTRKLFMSATIPTLYDEDSIAGEAQRIRSGWGRLNLYARTVVTNVFSKNGVVHGLDHILVPPPPAHVVLEILPGQFSTLVNALYKTGLMDHLKDGKHYGTLFAPSNGAFKRLGPKVLAFLFSKFGEKYLKALIEYHISPSWILYSDHFAKPGGDDSKATGAQSIPKGRFHADLRTLLEGKDISVDIARWGRFIRFRANGTPIIFQDGIVKDGVVHVPAKVLIPPHKHVPGDDGDALLANDDEICFTVESLKKRLEPYLT